MTDYEMICQESKSLSAEEQAQVLQYIQQIQNSKARGVVSPCMILVGQNRA